MGKKPAKFEYKWARADSSADYLESTEIPAVMAALAKEGWTVIAGISRLINGEVHVLMEREL